MTPLSWTHYQLWRDRFAEAIDERLFSIDYLDWQVLQPHVRMWASDESAIIAELRQYPTGALVVHGVVAAGELAEIVKLIPEAEQWGREHGCIMAIIESRPGWARALRHSGYESHQIALRKAL